MKDVHNEGTEGKGYTKVDKERGSWSVQTSIPTSLWFSLSACIAEA